MQATINKIAITPAQLAEDGTIKKPEFVRLILDVGLDTPEQVSDVVGLFRFLRGERFDITVEAQQLRFTGMA